MAEQKNTKTFKSMNRRELFKLAPVLALGAFATPKLREPLLEEGLAFSDWASAVLFRQGHMATTFDDSEVAPLEQFSADLELAVLNQFLAELSQHHSPPVGGGGLRSERCFVALQRHGHRECRPNTTT